MRHPRLSSVVERRLLVNYRLAPEIAARLLPDGLRPQLVRGHAVAGICLLRLGEVRPSWAPKAVGLRSENAAHRIAVEWDGPGGVETGVYIPRRDTASALTVWAGGRLFPGEHGRADFEVRETPDELRVAYTTRDGGTSVDVTVEVTPELRGSALFDDLRQASGFFERGARGYSPAATGTLDGMELHTAAWRLDACRIVSVRSSFFESLPEGSAKPDCALVMRGVPASWRPLPAIRPLHLYGAV
ncbi:DUF2071 domain-containing protein [Planobispora siamensis]|uniref:DUF2071 domain-containing protein n=1 Tax=Planobispora siamensis TaxID=936338 RepID=A0A8J3SPG5_9ACTN|nr:DUF2071 domain-containing protein [Planobispora siamensis]GIH96039.1 hypothetical protein Psi01_66690 [Planobispora siamensis]